MKKVVLKVQEKNMYIMLDNGVEYALTHEYSKAKRFSELDAKNFIRKHNKEYGFISTINIGSDNINNENSKCINLYNNGNLNILELSNFISNFPDIMKMEKDKLFVKLRKLENAVLDINHFQENAFRNDINVDFEKIERLRTRILVKRREIKDSIRMINIMDNYFNKECDMSEELSKMNNRIYTPRELDSLFDENYTIPEFNDWWCD